MLITITGFIEKRVAKGSDAMTESGGFRVSLRGFRRQDVLNYIDELQEEHRAREQRLQNGLITANQMLRELSDEVDKLRDSLLVSGGECERLRDDLQQAGEECTRLKEEVARAEEREETYAEQSRECRRQAEAYESAREQLMAAQARLADAEALRRKEAAEQAGVSEQAKEARARYDALARDVEQLTEQLSTRGKEFLDASCEQGEICLDDVEQLIDSIAAQLLDVRRRIGDSRERLEEWSTAAGMQIDRLVRSVGGEVPADPEAEDAAEPEPADVPEPDPDHPPDTEAKKPDVLDRLMAGTSSRPTAGQGSVPGARRTAARTVRLSDRSSDSGFRRWLDGLFGS